MKEKVIKKLLKGNAINTYLILYSPLIIGFLLFFMEPLILGKIGKFPLVMYFFPFPFLFFQILWMESASQLLLEKMEYEVSGKLAWMNRLFRVSKWTFLVLSVQTILIPFLMINDFKKWNIVVLYSFMIIQIVLMLLMLLSYYAVYKGISFMKELLLLAESQQSENIEVSGKVLSNRIFLPWEYIQIHNRIKKIIN